MMCFETGSSISTKNINPWMRCLASLILTLA
jgi:hypothetical protein